MNADRSAPDVTQRQAIHLAEAVSSLSGDHLSTLAAPTFAAPTPDQQHPPFKAGERIDDYELVKELGKGGFATVFLARQISLGRYVALKIGPNRGREAQTLASLEHDHIIQVFSETILEVRQSRLLCMQYVAGATLADVMQKLTPEIRSNGRGKDFLASLDQVSNKTEEFRPSALQERQQLAEGTFFEAICWIGARLSSALEFAHDQGVLHRDIKPANILINSYGRPFLADFNLATHGAMEAADQVGGTLPYMSPEQLQAFVSKKTEDWSRVDERSDLYSLGVVLYELATGHRPYSTDMGLVDSLSEGYAELLTQRFEPVASLYEKLPTIPASLDVIIRRCLAPQPDQRYGSAAELRQALENCRTHLQSMAQLPKPPFWTGYFHRHPFLSLLIISTVTNVLATVVNWSYNLIQIVGDFTALQRQAFNWVVIIYNTIAFPVLVGITAYLIRRRHDEWCKLHDGRLVSAPEIVSLRRRLNFLATWSILGSLIGWLPGGIIFPLAIHWGGEHLTKEQFLHFGLSFTLSGLIAITYCYLGSQYVVLRVLLPRLSCTSDQKDCTLGQELRILPFRLMLFQVLAGVIPLSGALMLVMMGPTHPGDNWFRILVCLLIVFGMVGFVLALQVTHFLQRVLDILLNPERRTSNG